MKKYLSFIFAAILLASFLAPTQSVEAANAINITADGTFPNPGPDGTNLYWKVQEGKKYAFSFKGTFVTASLDIQEAYVDEATGAEVWGSLAGKDAVIAVEDFQFIAIGNKIRIVVTLETTDDIDVLGPTSVSP